MPKALIATIAIHVLALAGAAHAVDITACGQTVAPREIGVLQNDLTCNGPGFGVRLDNGAVLDLGNHTLTIEGVTPIGVECFARCSVLGPGTVARVGLGPSGGGIVATAKSRVTVTGATLDGFAIAIHTPFARLVISDTTIQNSHNGIDARRIDVTDVTITAAPQFGNNCITGVTGRIRGQNLTLGGCTNGIYVGRKVDLTGLTWSGGDIGVRTNKRVKLEDSSITGATTADIASARPPRLVNTTCDRSAIVDSDGHITSATWGVCANDCVYSKHLHIFTAPLNVMFKRRPTALGPPQPMRTTASRRLRGRRRARRRQASAGARSRTSPGRASSTSPPAPSAAAARPSARPGTPASRCRRRW